MSTCAHAWRWRARAHLCGRWLYDDFANHALAPPAGRNAPLPITARPTRSIPRCLRPPEAKAAPSCSWARWTKAGRRWMCDDYDPARFKSYPALKQGEKVGHLLLYAEQGRRRTSCIFCAICRSLRGRAENASTIEVPGVPMRRFVSGADARLSRRYARRPPAGRGCAGVLDERAALQPRRPSATRFRRRYTYILAGKKSWRAPWREKLGGASSIRISASTSGWGNPLYPKLTSNRSLRSGMKSRRCFCRLRGRIWFPCRKAIDDGDGIRCFCLRRR